MIPDFSISVEGISITELIKSRLVSMHITDEAGVISDTAVIHLDDRDSLFEIPRTGAKLNILLGYKETGIMPMGDYIVNEITIQGSPQALKIKSHAADLKQSLKEQVFNEWHQITLNDLVEKIAGNHGYKAKVAAEFANIMISHIDQAAESDMHFLTRLAQIYGAIAKPAGGYLLFVSKGKAKSVTGKTLSTITLTPRDITSWQVRFNERNQYGSVIAYWYDYEKAETMTEKMGNQEPSYILRDIYANSDLAQSAASAKLNQLMSGAATLNITMPGSPELFAEAKINLLGFHKGVYGEWIINKAEHVIDNLGYRTIITAAMGIIDSEKVN